MSIERRTDTSLTPSAFFACLASSFSLMSPISRLNPAAADSRSRVIASRRLYALTSVVA